MHRFVGRKIGVDRRLIGYVDLLDGVGEDEAVDAYHGRDREFLGQPEGDDVQVGRFLVGFGEQLIQPDLRSSHRI